MIVDSHDNLIDFMITGGTTHDIKVAPDLISILDLKETKVVCANKGYDSEPLCEQIRKQEQRQIYQGKQTTNQKMIIWIGIYIRSGIELKICFVD